LRGQFRFTVKPRRIPYYFLTETDNAFIDKCARASKQQNPRERVVILAKGYAPSIRRVELRQTLTG
jgi:hypothetical protein